LLPQAGYDRRTGVGVFGGGIVGLASPVGMDSVASYYHKRQSH
jgi:hypothetical protein